MSQKENYLNYFSIFHKKLLTKTLEKCFPCYSVVCEDPCLKNCMEDYNLFYKGYLMLEKVHKEELELCEKISSNTNCINQSYSKALINMKSLEDFMIRNAKN